MIRQEAHKLNQFMRICNMKIEEMVEGLNRHIDEQRLKRNILSCSHLVFQLSITPHSTIKAYKKYEAIVWFVNSGLKYRVATVQQIAQVTEGKDDYILRVINIDMSKALFSLIGTKAYQEIIEGTYDGNTNE